MDALPAPKILDNLLLPRATLGGRFVNNMAGTEIRPPPPTMESTKPANAPATASKMSIRISNGKPVTAMSHCIINLLQIAHQRSPKATVVMLVYFILRLDDREPMYNHPHHILNSALHD